MSFEIENGILKKYTGNDTEIIIPKDITRIEDNAFMGGFFGNSIVSVYIPESVESIGYSAFAYCRNLQRITIPQSLKHIDSYVFYNCSSLTSVTLPEGLTSVNKNTFAGCTSLKDISLPESLTCIEDDAFNGCASLTNVVIPQSVTNIGSRTFYGCSQLKSITLPNSLQKIRDYLFSECQSLSSIDIPQSVTSIGSVAFKGCTSLSSIVLPESVIQIGNGAFDGCTSLSSIILPENITQIGNGAFDGCTSLSSIALPSGITHISKSLFEDCTALTAISLPEGIRIIEDNAFKNCCSLEHITLPEGIERIGNNMEGYVWSDCGAFQNCTALKEIILPQSINSLGPFVFSGCNKLKTVILPPKITYVDSSAFAGCTRLESMILPQGIKRIYARAFSGCTNFTRLVLPCADMDISVAANAFENCPKLTTKILTEINLRIDGKLPSALALLNVESCDEERAYVLLHQGNSKAWIAWVTRTAENAPALLEYCMTLLSEQKKILATMYKPVIEFMLEKESELQPEAIMKMLDFLKSKKCKVDTEQFRSIAHLTSGEKNMEVHPIEAFVEELLTHYTIAEEARDAVKKGTKIHYTSGEGIASIQVLQVLLSESVYAWQKQMYSKSEEWVVERLSMGKTASFSEIADKIAAALHPRELSVFLAKQTTSISKYRPFMLAHCRYADEEAVGEIISKIAQNTRGQAPKRYWAENMTTALYHNDTRAAMFYFDKRNSLKAYAAMRSISALELRDSLMMPQFDFDADGIKRYDIGGNIIEVRINPDLSFQLFDTAKGKIVRSIPKKSDDPEKAAACAEDFKAFKKTVQDFYKLRTGYMHDLHMSGEALSSEMWHNIYLTHPVLKLLTRLLVWQDETKNSFIPLEDGIIDSQGNAYAPQGKITLAHVLSLSREEVDAWQKYLSEHSLVQPFAQMWESIVSFNPKAPYFHSRYENVVLSKPERSALKKALTAWGIDMRSAGMEREFDHRGWTYEYSNESTFCFNDSFSLEYTVDPDTGLTTLEKISHCSEKITDARRVNAVLLHLDRAAIRSRIIAGDDATLTASLYDNFTAAQISEFISLSIEQNQTACTALLLNYKNEHFPDFADMDEFSLDW